MRHWKSSVLCSAPTARSVSLKYTLYFPLHHYWHTHNRGCNPLTHRVCNTHYSYLKDGPVRCVRSYRSVKMLQDLCLCPCVWFQMVAENTRSCLCVTFQIFCVNPNGAKQVSGKDFHVSNTWTATQTFINAQKKTVWFAHENKWFWQTIMKKCVIVFSLPH